VARAEATRAAAALSLKRAAWTAGLLFSAASNACSTVGGSSAAIDGSGARSVGFWPITAA
jgi:hypothetical protein